MKYFPIVLTLFSFFAGSISCFSQLVIKGVIYSDNLVMASLKSEHSLEREVLYLYPPRKNDGEEDTKFSTKYQVPERMVKNENYILRFTDGKVEKMVYISGAVPKDIAPKQKFRIDIDMLSNDESDMTLIVYWSISQSSYRALPLSQINEIRSDASPDFFWEDGTIPEDQLLKESAN